MYETKVYIKYCTKRLEHYKFHNSTTTNEKLLMYLSQSLIYHCNKIRHKILIVFIIIFYYYFSYTLAVYGYEYMNILLLLLLYNIFLKIELAHY